MLRAPLFGLPMQIPSRPSGPLLIELPERYDVRARHGLRLSISTSRMVGQFRPEWGTGAVSQAPHRQRP